MGIRLGRSLISSLNGVDIKVTRQNVGGSYVDGLWVPAPAVEVSILGSIQPLGGKDIVRIPEGDRTRQRLKVYSSDKALISRDIILKEADELCIGCDKFQVESVEYWPEFYKLIVVKMNITGEEQ